jgi:hypothetical protein
MKSRNILLFILLLTGCERITEGIITDKQYTPGRTALVLTTVYINKSVRIVPRAVRYNESWTITIRSMTGEKERRQNIAVTQEVFESLKTGDYFSTKRGDGGGL